jgi:hypothetical protein
MSESSTWPSKKGIVPTRGCEEVILGQNQVLTEQHKHSLLNNNSMKDLNPEIEEGKEYLLDATFNNCSIVKVLNVGSIYATVTDGTNTWETMKTRLSSINNNNMDTFTDTYGNCPQCGQQPSKVFHPTCGDQNSEGCPWRLPKTLGKTYEIVFNPNVPDCYGNYPTDTFYKGEPKTGVELIAKERHEQFEKHGRTIEEDVRNNTKEQLSRAAKNLLELRPHRIGCPDGWSEEIWQKMASKPYKERLIIAGALIAAELDRLINTGEPIPFEEVPINKP